MIYFFVSLITYITYQTLKTRKVLINQKKYKEWLFTKKNFITPELLGIVIIIIAFTTNSKITGICVIILYMILSLLEINKIKEKQKLNKQNIKIAITTIIVYLLMFLLFIIDYNNMQREFFMVDHSKYYYMISIIIGYLHYLILLPIIKIHNIKHKLK